MNDPQRQTVGPWALGERLGRAATPRCGGDSVREHDGGGVEAYQHHESRAGALPAVRARDRVPPRSPGHPGTAPPARRSSARSAGQDGPAMAGGPRRPPYLLRPGTSQLRADVGDPGLTLFGYQAEVNPAFARREAACQSKTLSTPSRSVNLLSCFRISCSGVTRDRQMGNGRIWGFQLSIASSIRRSSSATGTTHSQVRSCS